MKKLALVVTLLLAPSLLSAQILSRARIYSQLGTCSKDGEIKIITDALTAGTCAAGGSALAACWCDLSTTSWISTPLPSASLSDYALLTGANFTGAVTVTSAVPGEPILGVTLNAGDESGDSKFSVTGPDGSVFEMGCDTVPACIFTVGVGSNTMSVSSDGGVHFTGSDGSGTAEIYLMPDGTAQIYTANGCLDINSLNWCGATAQAPYPCLAGAVGYYTDTTGPDLCYCNATAWAPVDGTGTCDEAVD